VDDGSNDGTAEQIKKWPVKYICQKNTGPAAARNKGWKASSGEIICFTDSDCIPRRDWLSKLLRNYQGDKIGAVGGSYDVANPEDFLAYCVQEEISIRHSNMPREVRFLGSYNLSVKRSVLEEVGGFQEGYKKASGEDNDLSYKIRKHGYRVVFDKEALVAHYHRESLWRYLEDQYTHGFWRAKLYVEHPDMGSGDDYTRLKDIVEVPLCLGLLAVMPLLWPSSLWLVFLALLFLLQLGMALNISLRSRRPLCLLFAFVTFLRCFARTLGFLRGLLALGKVRLR
ncbi:MAG: glycosyltransferase, partial [Candidatus Brocadiales bacterium]